MKIRGNPMDLGDSPAASSRKKFILGIVVAIFLSLWMFGLGILVGRGTAPVHFDMEKLQNELASLKQAVLKEEQQRFKIMPDVKDQETGLDFYEELKSTDDAGQVRAEIPPALKQPPPRPKPQPTPKPVPKVLQEPQPAPVEPPPAQETYQPRGEYTIQVASLKDPQVANRMVLKLKNNGFPAYRTIGKIPDKGIWYRVRIGSYNSRAKAKQMLERLGSAQITGIIVQQ